jgi:Formate-tetrahydrofolate ligase (EC 6.3.4.3)
MQNSIKTIGDVAREIGLSEYAENYGRDIAKISLSSLDRSAKKKGKLILVTATNPTPSGEGKTTTVIGLGQSLKLLGKKVGIAIREPSLGPCFGIKGGATGGGKSCVEPSDRINLIFTGDFPAVSAAHNLLSALINNHIYHGNELRIDPKRIIFPRTVDMNDRSLRQIIVGAGGRDTGAMTGDNFVIVPASEIMAILGLSRSYKDLKDRLGKITVAFTYEGKPVFASDLKANGAMAAILVEALKPNLVMTTEGVPAFIHTGPFGNIAHGTSSIIADKIALSHLDYVVTEAGFGSDLGAQKFFDIVTREAEIEVSAVVIVSTLKAIKYNGKAEVSKNVSDVIEDGFKNLRRHVEIIRSYGFEPIVSINMFDNDDPSEIEILGNLLKSNSIKHSMTRFYQEGGKGGIDLANSVLQNIKPESTKPNYTYSTEESPEGKDKQDRKEDIRS